MGRLVDWKFSLFVNKQAIPAFCEQNAQLWFDAFGELVAFAISENGDGGFVILSLEGYRFLFKEMLEWVLAHWGNRSSYPEIEITEFQEQELSILEQYGFNLKGNFFSQRFDLTQELPVPSPLEKGFSIVDMKTHPDYREQRILRDNAFAGKKDVPEEVLAKELTFYNHNHQGPIYYPQADLCVLNETGKFVAGCEALIDARNATADVERICTHSDFRRRGFARAVVIECFYRLQELGMKTVFIAGYSPEAISLYQSLGHVDQKQCFIYNLNDQS